MRTSPETTRIIDLRGLRLRISSTAHDPSADGVPPLLLCSGIGACLELWRPFLGALGDWPTVAFDAPGVGSSDTPWYPPTFGGLAVTVGRLLDHLGVDQVDVLGVSWGGGLAQELARRFPDRVRRLVLAATATGLTTIPGHPRVLIKMATPLRYWSRHYFERVAPTIYGGEILDDPDLLRQQAWQRFTHQVSAKAYLWQLLAARRWTSLPWLHRLTQPTLVMAGERDPLVPMANARLLAARIPRATLHVVPNGSHLFLATRADEVVPVITTFLTTGDGAHH